MPVEGLISQRNGKAAIVFNAAAVVFRKDDFPTNPKIFKKPDVFVRLK